jgi:hypothetical protein
MYPDVNDSQLANRYDDLGWLVRAGPEFAGGGFLVLNTASALGNGISTSIGDLWLDPADRFFSLLVTGPAPLAASGNDPGSGSLLWSLGPRAPGNPLRDAVGNFGSWHSQAIVWNADLSRVTLSNLDMFTLPWAGATTFQIDASQPLRITQIGAYSRIQVQNEGKGTIAVERWNQDRLLGSSAVRERLSTVAPIENTTTEVRIVTPVVLALGQVAVRGSYRWIR